MRFVVARQPHTVASPEPWEAVRAMRGYEDSVEALDVVGSYPVLLVDLALFYEGGGVEVGQRRKVIVLELALEHDVATLIVECVDTAQHDIAFGAVLRKQVGEAGTVLSCQFVAKRRKSGCLDPLGLNSVGSRKKSDAVAVEGFLLTRRTHEIARIEFMIS
jgi:hypothetical protein